MVEADFTRGILRDEPRSSIPVGGLYDCLDFIIDQRNLARERGGTTYSGAALGANSYAASCFYADFSTGGKLVAVADNGHLFEVAGSSTDRATLGSTFLPVDTHKMVSDLVVLPSNDGTTAPKKGYISGGTLTGAAIGGSPPAGKFVEVYYSRIVLAGVAATPRRVFFSPIPNVESTWDTTNSYVDAGHNVTGLCALKGALLVFSDGHMERIAGTTPPPESDMSIVTIDNYGCIDARSIATYNNTCIFANKAGVYLTNGVSFDTLTERPDGSGIGTYWRSLMSSYSASTWTVAGGVFPDYDDYVVCVMNGTTLIDTLVCHIPSRQWRRLGNVKAKGFSTQFGSTSELHYADAASPRVIGLVSTYVKSATVKNDANGTAVAGTLEYRMVGQGIGLKAYLDGRLNFDLRDAASDNPTLAVQIATGVGADTYAAVTESPLSETSTATRKGFTVSKDAQSVNVKLIRAAAASKAEIYGLEDRKSVV